MKKSLVFAAVAASMLAGAVHAQDLPKTQLKVVGGLSNLTAYNDYEKPFWTKTIPELSKGQVTAEIKGFNEMGLKGPELLRLMSQGVIEFGTATLSYFASDNPINEAIDLAGLAPDVKTARAVTDAFEPVYAKLYGEGNNVKLLGISTYPAQVLFCNAEIKSLADIKGKKVRTSSRTTAEFVEALGGSSVTMAFGEVVPALQNKVVDCAITGSLSGYSAKWYEVSTHLVALPINWNQQIHAVNQKAWDKLDPAVRTFLQANVKTLVDNIWEAAARQTQEGYDCNTGAAASPVPGQGQDGSGAAVGRRPCVAQEGCARSRVAQVGRPLLGAVREGLQRHHRQDAGPDRQQVSAGQRRRIARRRVFPQVIPGACPYRCYP
ncbi:bacterial extracellular solute-binding protein, family 7 [Achromobacter piechaudii ATCC 43553]|uniref:Bacterial extracellular solute-binding protein, family 7 n=1 Tax=Achromobacter piechaudii ATCC 43553 TaxID=742159 RepID=D4XDS5_9BURK|nr:bacterial extracellular solute-binding protein, family 7 [Achromobacter piechaudii ATCC 43553]